MTDDSLNGLNSRRRQGDTRAPRSAPGRKRTAQEISMTDDQKRRSKRAFLDSFRVIGVVSRAAIDAGVSRKTVYNWLKNDQDFKVAFDAAEEDARDEIRDEIHRRAIEGWDEPVYQRGAMVGSIRKKSDALLIKMAAARLPEYRSLVPQQKPVEEPNADHKVVVEIIEVDDWRNVQRVKS